MSKNSQLAIVALAFIASSFGIWYIAKSPSEIHAGPISATKSMSAQERTAKVKAMTLKEIPESVKKVEKALDSRWGDMEEKPLTAASVNEKGEMVFFDKNVVAGLLPNGELVYAQGAHRSHILKGPTLKNIERKPITLSLEGKTPGKGFFMNAIRKGKLKENNGKKPAVELPASADQ